MKTGMSMRVEINGNFKCLTNLDVDGEQSSAILTNLSPPGIPNEPRLQIIGKDKTSHNGLLFLDELLEIGDVINIKIVQKAPSTEALVIIAPEP